MDKSSASKRQKSTTILSVNETIGSNLDSIADVSIDLSNSNLNNYQNDGGKSRSQKLPLNQNNDETNSRPAMANFPYTKKINRQIVNQQLWTTANDRRSEFRQNFAFVNVLIVNAFERFAFYGIICNFILYLNKQPLYWESYNATLMLFVFLGLTHVLSVIGGWIADSLLDKYKTILLGFLLYLVGYVSFPLISFDETSVPGFCNANTNKSTNFVPVQSFFRPGQSDEQTKLVVKNYLASFHSDIAMTDEACSWAVIVSCILISVGVGFVRSNLGPFGADQVISRGESYVFKYFNWIYWSTNCGSLLSFSALAYLQQNVSFFIGYTMPFAFLAVASILFLVGKFSYIAEVNKVSILTNIFRVIMVAFKSRREARKNFSAQVNRERE